jgi:hypothetical protein
MPLRRIHGNVERVLWIAFSAWSCEKDRMRTYTSDNLMKMWRRIRAWIHERIKTLDGELRATEAEKARAAWL